MKGIKGSTLPLSENIARERILKLIKEKNNSLGCELEFLGFAENWHGTTTKLKLKCNKHGIIWEQTSYNNFMKPRTVGCPMCKSEKTIRTHLFSPEDAYNILVKKYKEAGIDTLDFTPILTTYEGFHKSVKVRCKKHNVVFEMQYITLLNNVHGNHCPECYDEFRRTTRGPEEAELTSRVLNKISLLAERGFDIEFLGYKLGEGEFHPSTNSKLVLRCNIHNVTWDTTSVSNFVNSNGVFCPECSRHNKRSNGEKYCYSEVLKYVDSTNISSDTEITFSDPRFYNVTNTILPDIYITVPGESDIIIEYDGEQHYRFVEHVHREFERYIRQVRRDQFLETYCKENNIKLLRIPWKDENRIPEIIRSFLVDGIDITTKVYPKIPPSSNNII